VWSERTSGDIVDAAGHVRKERTDFGPGLAVPIEFPLRPLEKNPLVAGAILDLGMVELDFFANVGRQPRLRIERVDMRHAAGHEQKDHVLGLGRKMPTTRRERIGNAGANRVVSQQLAKQTGHQKRPGDERLQ
jgi:hypothetical protein